MTLAGQAFWRDQEKTMPLLLPECPCCGRPYPIGAAVFEHAAAVAEATYGVSPQALLSPSRSRPVSNARTLVVWALRSLGQGLSYDAIGRRLGGRHQSSIVNLHQKAISMRLRDPQFAQACERIVFALTATRGASDGSN